MKKITWIFIFLAGTGALLFGCHPGIIPVQPTSISTFPNPFLLYDGTHGQINAPVSIQVFANYTVPNSSGVTAGTVGCPVSVVLNYQDTTTPYPGNLFCMSMAIDSYTNNCEPFAIFAFRTINLAPTDYSSGNFSTAIFYARSVPATSISFGFLGSTATTLSLTTDWVQYSLPLTGNLTAVTAIMEVGGASPPTVPTPYTIYMDQVQFQ
jgi:hypothetical protein